MNAIAKKGLHLCDLYKDAFKLFFTKRGTNLAAASTFYLLLTLIPLALLSFKIVGLLLGNVHEVLNETFAIIGRFFPNAIPEFLNGIKTMVMKPLDASGGVTTINIFFLMVSTFSLFNSIWSGLYFLTDNKTHVSLKKAIKDLLLVSFTVSFLGISLVVPGVLKFFRFLLTKNSVLDIIAEIVPRGDVIVRLWVSSNSFFFSLFESDLFYAALLVIYITFLFHWFFSRHLKWKQSFFVATSFVISLLILKSLFWIYLKYARGSLAANYGDFYTFVIGVMWLYFAMCCFYLSLCLCQSFKKIAVKSE
ncbi:virulence factor BrkB [Bacteriovorax sp. BSW11_IV]|uniref:YhjD/YihY/BrkB family envelope integrity protein n=1 Tax=Bacteriovorax sp. BSW11_IV TaxID=1353529 RepID=UPI00038A1E99|nr:YhjD/YihY/BrkB family envelope integrity protein [Bacteriovorax sp. BSW11_IV]EQC49088.1 virulence factor BrkB [Bacteriovorax sp. BSW11_IV]